MSVVFSRKRKSSCYSGLQSSAADGVPLSFQSIQQLLMNAAEAAVRHYYYHVIRAQFRRKVPDNRVRAFDGEGLLARRAQIADQFLHRQLFFGGNAEGLKQRGDDDVIRRGEGLRVDFLENLFFASSTNAARRRRRCGGQGISVVCRAAFREWPSDDARNRQSPSRRSPRRAPASGV